MLRVIKVAQRLGFSLGEVAELLVAGRHQHGARPDGSLQQRAAAKLVEVDQKLDELNVIRETLLGAMAAGCDDLVTCAGSTCCPLRSADLALESDSHASVR